jgi:hypothetical protein
VATNNVTFKLNDVEALARRKFAELAPEVRVNTCNSVKKIEEAFIQKQHMLEEALDTLCFSVNTGSSDEEYDSAYFRWMKIKISINYIVLVLIRNGHKT